MRTLLRTAAVSFCMLLLAASAGAQERWEIVKAEYGTGDRWVDVTPRVLLMVRHDMLDFRVSHDSLNADPAHGQHKYLRMQLRDMRGQIREMTFEDLTQVHLYIGAGRGPVGNNPYERGLRINRAQYGGKRMADVTARLGGMVRDDRLTLQVSNDSMGVDPEKGRPKHLTVDFTWNGTPGQVTLREGETLELPGSGNWSGGANGGPNGGNGTLTILRAEYGAGSREFDVTSRLASRVRGNSLQVRANNDNMGGDPAERQVKSLEVWYQYNNRSGHTTVRENDVLTLPGTGDTDYYQGHLQVTRAQYGADVRFTDVTSLLNSRIQNDSLSLRISNDSMGSDPALGERKVLTVFYIYNGRQARAFANEGDLLSLPVGTAQGGRGDRDDDDDDYYRRFWPGRSSTELRVLQASWGAEDRSRDVTGQLNGLVRANQLNVAVNNGTMGGDPAPGASKRLRVIYMMRGLRYETNVPDGGSLVLP